MKTFPSILSGELFSQKLFAYFVDKGDIENMDWMNYNCYQYNCVFEDGTIVDNETSNRSNHTIWSISVFDIVLIKKDFVIFKWLINNIYDDYDDNILELLIKNGNLKFLEYFLLQDFPIKINPLIIAIEYGKIRIFNLLTKYGFIVDDSIIENIIKYGKLELLRYIYYMDNELILTNKNKYYQQSIEYGYLDISEWFKTI